MTADTFKKTVLFPWLICALGALFYCYEYFLRITPSVMTGELMRSYDLTGAEVGSLSACYYLAYVPMQLLVGILMDRFGPRFLLTQACFLCAVGSYFFASSQYLAVAQAGRFLVGFGSAFAFVGALKLATIWLPPNRFALISGIITCLGMIGAMLGDIILHHLVDAMGWRMTINMSAIAGLFLTVIMWSFIRDVNPHDVSKIHHEVMRFRALLKGLGGALLNRQIWLNGIIGMLLYLSLSAFGEMWGISYLHQALGFSKSQAANANSMIFVGWAIGGPFWGWFSDYIKRRRLPMTIGSIFSVAIICILLYVPHHSTFGIYLLLFLFGFMTSVEILIFAICHEVSHIRIAGTAIALTNFIVMISGNVFQPLIGKILDLHWAGVMEAGARVYPNQAYQIALSSLPIAIGLAILVSFFIRETRCIIQHHVHRH